MPPKSKRWKDKETMLNSFAQEADEALAELHQSPQEQSAVLPFEGVNHSGSFAVCEVGSFYVDTRGILCPYQTFFTVPPADVAAYWFPGWPPSHPSAAFGQQQLTSSSQPALADTKSVMVSDSLSCASQPTNAWAETQPPPMPVQIRFIEERGYQVMELTATLTASRPHKERVFGYPDFSPTLSSPVTINDSPAIHCFKGSIDWISLLRSCSRRHVLNIEDVTNLAIYQIAHDFVSQVIGFFELYREGYREPREKDLAFLKKKCDDFQKLRSPQAVFQSTSQEIRDQLEELTKFQKDLTNSLIHQAAVVQTGLMQMDASRRIPECLVKTFQNAQVVIQDTPEEIANRAEELNATQEGLGVLDNWLIHTQAESAKNEPFHHVFSTFIVRLQRGPIYDDGTCNFAGLYDWSLTFGLLTEIATLARHSVTIENNVGSKKYEGKHLTLKEESLNKSSKAKLDLHEIEARLCKKISADHALPGLTAQQNLWLCLDEEKILKKPNPLDLRSDIVPQLQGHLEKIYPPTKCPFTTVYEKFDIDPELKHLQIIYQSLSELALSRATEVMDEIENLVSKPSDERVIHYATININGKIYYVYRPDDGMNFLAREALSTALKILLAKNLLADCEHLTLYLRAAARSIYWITENVLDDYQPLIQELNRRMHDAKATYIELHNTALEEKALAAQTALLAESDKEPVRANSNAQKTSQKKPNKKSSPKQLPQKTPATETQDRQIQILKREPPAAPMDDEQKQFNRTQSKICNTVELKDLNGKNNQEKLNTISGWRNKLLDLKKDEAHATRLATTSIEIESGYLAALQLRVEFLVFASHKTINSFDRLLLAFDRAKWGICQVDSALIQLSTDLNTSDSNTSNAWANKTKQDLLESARVTVNSVEETLDKTDKALQKLKEKKERAKENRRNARKDTDAMEEKKRDACDPSGTAEPAPPMWFLFKGFREAPHCFNPDIARGNFSERAARPINRETAIFYAHHQKLLQQAALKHQAAASEPTRQASFWNSASAGSNKTPSTLQKQQKKDGSTEGILNRL